MRYISTVHMAKNRSSTVHEISTAKLFFIHRNSFALQSHIPDLNIFSVDIFSFILSCIRTDSKNRDGNAEDWRRKIVYKGSIIGGY